MSTWTIKHSERAAARLLLLQGADPMEGFLDRACRMSGWTSYIFRGLRPVEAPPTSYHVEPGEAAFRAILGGTYFGFDVARQDLEVRIVLEERSPPWKGKESGIDEMRTAVTSFGYCNETFNTDYTAEELLQLARMHRACDWDVYPDDWSKRQVREALIGHVPRFSHDLTPVYSPLLPLQETAASEHADLLRAIGRRAGHSVQSTPAIVFLVSVGLLRIDEIELAELTDYGEQWLNEHPDEREVPLRKLGEFAIGGGK